MSLFRMRIQYGSLMLGECWLITLTQKADQEDDRINADSVGRALTELVRTLKIRSPELSWLKVVEVTKRGTPHLHLIVGGLTKNRSERCCGEDPPYSSRWIQEDCRKDCLIHEWGREWFHRSGNFVVDVRKVHDAGGVAGYLSKYLTKGFLLRERLEALGFVRRWACSRNWPREKQIRLRGSLGQGWYHTEVVARSFQKEKMKALERRDKNAYMMQQVGDDLGLLLRSRIERRGQLARVSQLEKRGLKV